MTSIKFHFRPSSNKVSDEGRLFVRLIHKRRPAVIRTGYKVRVEEWNKQLEQLELPHDDPERKSYLEEIQVKLDEIRHLLESSISQYSLRGDYEVEDIVKSYIRTPEGDALREFVEILRLQMISNDQVRTARAYRSAVTSFQKFIDAHGMTIKSFESGLLKHYECWMLERGLMMNTVSFYMRNLRAIYNKAVAANLIKEVEAKPFREVYTGVFQTRHRALTEEQLNSLSALEEKLHNTKEAANTKCNIREPELNSKLKNALNYFLFCFHARGMSYIDMAYLKKSEITGDTILYKRKKTGRFLEVKITEPMRLIMQQYENTTALSPYVFPLISPAKDNHRRQYENSLTNQNSMLGILSEMAGLDTKLTTHVSRHTWASIAKRHKVDIAVISEALGHSSIRVTEIYLDSFGRSVLDNVSDQVSGVIKTKKIAA